MAVTHDFKNWDKRKKPWLARITGVCAKWGFKREFENATYNKYNDTFNELVFLLEKNCVYEYRNFLVDHLSFQYSSGFFATLENKVVELEKEQIRTWLHLPNKKPKQKKEETNYTVDDIAF